LLSSSSTSSTIDEIGSICGSLHPPALIAGTTVAQQLLELLHKLLRLVLALLLLLLLLLLRNTANISGCGAGVAIYCSGPPSQQCSPLQQIAAAGPTRTSCSVLLLLLLYKVHVSVTICCWAAVIYCCSCSASQQCSPLQQSAAAAVGNTAAGTSHWLRCTNLARLLLLLLLLLLQGLVLQECNSCIKAVCVSGGSSSCLGCGNARLLHLLHLLLLLLLALFSLLQCGYPSSKTVHAAATVQFTSVHLTAHVGGTICPPLASSLLLLLLGCLLLLLLLLLL
jgi:hypothetical protein